MLLFIKKEKKNVLDKNIIITVFCFFSVLSIVSCTPHFESDLSPKEPSPNSLVTYCSCGSPMPSNIQDLSTDALLGNSKSASSLFFYFNFGHYLPDKVEYWAQIGAEDGSPDNQMVFARILRGLPSPRNIDDMELNNQFRAFFWAKEASEADSEISSQSDANRFLFDPSSVRQFFWKEIASVPDQNVWIVKESKYLQNGGPRMFLDIDGIEFRERQTGYNHDQYYKIRLSKINIEAIKINALFGDVDAANYLFAHYRYIGDQRSYNYWLLIAAEDGDPEAQLSLAFFLEGNLPIQDHIRAKFWAEKVVKYSNVSKMIEQAESFLKDRRQ